MSHHGVEDREQLMHGGNQGHFLGFSPLEQALVEGPNDGIMPGCHEGCHGQRGADSGSPTHNLAFAPHLSTIAIHRCEAAEAG